MKTLLNKKILIISPEAWSHNFLSKHHYAIALAQTGNKVFFLNPPCAENSIVSSPIENLSVVNYSQTFRGLNKLPYFLSDLLARTDVSRIRRLTKTSFDVVWSFDPYRFQNLKLFKAHFNIYYAADIHRSKALNNRVASHADMVFAPSGLILNDISCDVPKYFISHAVADYFFSHTEPVSLPGKQQVKIGYVGNLHSKYINFELLRRAVQFNAECDFIFVGDNHNLPNSITGLANAYFLGKRSNHELPAILQGCNLFLLCYDTDKFWLEASNSHKIMEYLAIGNVVVSTKIAEYLDKKHLVVMPERNTDLPTLIQDVVTNLDVFNNADSQRTRKTYANQNTYLKQLEQIDLIIQKVLHD